jgi:hypothetical protein
MFCKIYSDLRKYPDNFFSYLRLSIGSLLTICENDLQNKIHKHIGRQWTGLRLSCDVDLAFVAALPVALALGILVGSDARRMPGAIYDYYINTLAEYWQLLHGLPLAS